MVIKAEEKEAIANYIKHFLYLLEKAVEEECRVESIGVLYSAGVDSTLLSFLASKYAKVTAYVTGWEGNSRDIEYALRTKSNVPFEVEIVDMDEREVEEVIPTILKIINKPNPVELGVGIPFYFACKKAKEDDQKIMLCAQGADELFGGYKKYIDCVVEEGYSALEKMMSYDLNNLPRTNLYRDRAIAELHSLHLSTPFLHEKVVEYVTTEIPIKLKVCEVENGEFECVDKVNNKNFIRKYLLRLAAREVGVPECILNRKKKAAQYGSGAQKILERLARKKGFKSKAKEMGRGDYVRMYIEEFFYPPSL